MMSEGFRLQRTMKLNPLLIALERPSTDYLPVDSLVATNPSPFSAVVDGGVRYPNSIYLFKGEECCRFNLATGKMETELMPISGEFGGDTFPLTFSTGIDAATWGGPTFPHLTFLFKGSRFIRFDSKSDAVIEGPAEIPVGWGSSAGNWFSKGCDSALHGVDPHGAATHIFKDGEYIRHNFLDGTLQYGPASIVSSFALPEPFASGFDLAFYGVGENAERIYFLRGETAVLYDLASGSSSLPFSLTEQFPELASYFPRPFLFLSEEYRLEMFVGETERGPSVSTTNVEPRKKKTIKIVTETVSSSSSSLQSSILDSQDASTAANFYDEIKRSEQVEGSTEESNFRFAGSVKGKYSTAAFTGSANAQATAHGGSDNVREEFGNAVQSATSKQVANTSRQLRQQVFTGDTEVTRTDRFLREELDELDNSQSDKLAVYEYYQQLEPWLTLLVLTDVRIAFTAGNGRSDVVGVAELDELLDRHVIPSAREEIRRYVVSELSNIADCNGNPRSIIKEVTAEGVMKYRFDDTVTTDYIVQQPDGSTQNVSVAGIVKRADMEKKRLQSLIGVQRS